MSHTINIRVKYFASIREALGRGQEALQTHCTTVAQLREELVARDARHAEVLAQGKAVRMALNQTVVEGDAQLSEGAEVAFFPPVTGG